MSFYNDIASYCKKKLLLQGYGPNDKSDRDIIYMFMNHYHRRIKTKPRPLYFSRELENSMPDKYKNNFNILCEKIKIGASLQEYLSRKINKPYNDSLFNGWSIHHFHLGKKLAKNGLIERTKHILMAMVFDDGFYAIKVYTHGEWANQEMIKIAYNNWPSMFKEKFYAYDYSHPPLTDVEVEGYRKKHIICPEVMDDGSRWWTGGGYMANGESMKVDMKLLILGKTCDALEKLLLQNKIRIITEAESKGVKFFFHS